MMKFITGMIVLLQTCMGSVDINIFADYIIHPELQIFVYNTTIGKITISDDNNTIIDDEPTLQLATNINRVYHSTINFNNLTRCIQYTQKDLNVSECGLKANSRDDSNELTNFSLVTLDYQNIT